MGKKSKHWGIFPHYYTRPFHEDWGYFDNYTAIHVAPIYDDMTLMAGHILSVHCPCYPDLKLIKDGQLEDKQETGQLIVVHNMVH